MRNPARASDGVSAASRGYYVLLAVIVLVQAALVAASFPLSEVLTAKPVLHIDSAYHSYQIYLAKILWGTHGVVGYDPYFAAGYVGGIPFNGSARVPAVLGLFLSDPTAPFTALKIFLVIASLLCVVAIPLACRSLGLSLRATCIAGLFGLLIFWATPMRWYFVAGMSSYVAAAYLAVPFACWTASAIIDGGWARVALLGLLGGCGLYCHPNFPILAAPFALILLATRWRSIVVGPAFARTIVVGAVALGVNLWWVLITVRYPDLFASAKQPYQQIVDATIPFMEAFGLAPTAGGGSRFYLVLIVGAVCGQLLARRRDVTTPLVATTVLFLALGAVGSVVPAIAFLQPNRFSVFAWLVLAIPAALGVAELYARLRTQGFRSLPVVGSLAFIVLRTGLYLVETAREISPNSKGYYGVRPPEVNGQGPITTELLEWVRTYTNSNGRILFEQSRGRTHDGVHVAPYVAQMTGRELIGGGYPYQHFATFLDGHVFGKELRTFDPEDLRRYLRIYNVQWVICHSKEARAYFSSKPWAKLEKEAAWGALFSIAEPGGYFIRGDGTITARSINLIKGRAESGQPAVLSYHWTSRLRVIPDVPLEREWMLDDPVPFIRMPRPPEDFEIRFEGGFEP